VGGFLSQAWKRGWGATLLVFRGCGSQPNTARRFYHSGETTDLDFVFRTVRDRWSASPLLLTGVSLGGNVLLKWLGEKGRLVARDIRAAAAVSVPFDLEAGARRISEGPFRIYDRSFLSSLRRKALAKLERIPDLLDRKPLERAKTVFEFDDCVTAPVHGFRGAIDYYSKSSSLHFLAGIHVPTLLLSASDDPFLPREVLARVRAQAKDNPALTTEFHEHGGHVGFVEGRWPWRPGYFAERRVFEFFDRAMTQIG
jgi:predicted alpha/beta-fold hydrolase